MALMGFLIVWIRRATLPPGSGMKDYEAIIVPVIVLTMLSIPFLLVGLGIWLSNRSSRGKKAKP
jgi:hypothetical protein